MADIPGAKVKMNDVEIAANAALSEALHNKYGANINALIDDVKTLKTETFTTSGTWTKPASLPSGSTVFLWGRGAGGGGGGGTATFGTGGDRAGEGGSGSYSTLGVTTVTGNVTVTIGTGGSGGAIDAGGLPGGNSTFGSFKFQGGAGGRPGGSLAAAPFGPVPGGLSDTEGQASPFADGGNDGSGGGAGGGGGAGDAAGGSGGATSNPGANGSLGSGGGGGSGNTTGSSADAGGDGGDGQIIVIWFEPAG